MRGWLFTFKYHSLVFTVGFGTKVIDLGGETRGLDIAPTLVNVTETLSFRSARIRNENHQLFSSPLARRRSHDTQWC